MGAPRHALPRGKEPVGASGLAPVSCGGVGRPAGLGPGEGRPGCQRRGHGPARPLGPRVRGSGGDPAPSAPLGRGCRGGRRRAGALARHRGRRRPRPRAGGDAVPGLPRGHGAALPVGLGGRAAACGPHLAQPPPRPPRGAAPVCQPGVASRRGQRRSGARRLLLLWPRCRLYSAVLVLGAKFPFFLQVGLVKALSLHRFGPLIVPLPHLPLNSPILLMGSEQMLPFSGK